MRQSRSECDVTSIRKSPKSAQRRLRPNQLTGVPIWRYPRKWEHTFPVADEEEALGTAGFWDRALGGRLWRNGDFMRLWVGQTISEAGTQVSQLAVPTVAILLLHATPFQVGLLTALEFLPFPVLGLVAGVYADRLKRRPLMIISDLGRMVALLTIPIALIG